MGNYKENMTFEAEVRRAAEAVWNVPPGDCQPKRYINQPGIGELDGIVRLRDVTHLIMATTSSKLDKVKEDVGKLRAAERVEKKADVTTPVVSWLITEKQLDALHVKHASEAGVKVMTLHDFMRRSFDGTKYVARRSSYPFGSAVHPKDSSTALDDQKYVELPIVLDARPETQGREQTATLDGLIDILLAGRSVVLLGPFGAGKSFTSREVFKRISRRMRDGSTGKTPVVLNLRDHWGESYGDEMLERHARAIGFTPKEELTIGWRAGLVTLVLDGFDELATQTVTRREDKNFMRTARRGALAGCRDLLTKRPGGSGVLITGRDHYFDNQDDLGHALGLLGQPYLVARLGEFDESRAIEFLRNNNVRLPLPDWLPRKPLLLGYLAHRALLQEVLAIDKDMGFGFVWDRFIDLVCAREASLATATMDSSTLRTVLEHLATAVRNTASGTGPIAESDLIEAYRKVAGQSPTDAVIAQLQRLPGLTERGQTQGTRSFVDEDLLRALQGSAIAKFILHGMEFSAGDVQWLDGLSAKGIATAAYLLEKNGASASVAISRAHNVLRQGGGTQLAADCVAIALALADEGATLDFLGMTVDGAMVRRIDLEETIINGLVFANCHIDEVVLGDGADQSSLVIGGCDIERLSGVANEAGIPTTLIRDGCTVQRYDNLGTNNAIVRSDLPPKVKALITVLRKLYIQRGSGRKVAAFYRGIPPGPVSAAVNDVLPLLEREGLMSVFNAVAHPVHRQGDRVRKILQAPALSDDPLVTQLR